MSEPKKRRPTFSLFSLLVLITGIAIGFTPLQWWRSRQPPHMFTISVHRADVRTEELEGLGLPNSSMTSQRQISDIDAIVKSLQSRLKNDSAIGYWSISFLYSIGHTPKWVNGGGIDVPVMKEDGTVAVVERYNGDTIIAEAEELANGNVLLSFDISNHSLDYGDPKMIGDAEIFPQFVRNLKTQIEIVAGTFVAVPAGKHTGKDGIERELILILSAERFKVSK